MTPLPFVLCQFAGGLAFAFRRSTCLSRSVRPMGSVTTVTLRAARGEISRGNLECGTLLERCSDTRARGGEREHTFYSKVELLLHRTTKQAGRWSYCFIGPSKQHLQARPRGRKVELFLHRTIKTAPAGKAARQEGGAIAFPNHQNSTCRAMAISRAGRSCCVGVGAPKWPDRAPTPARIKA